MKIQHGVIMTIILTTIVIGTSPAFAADRASYTDARNSIVQPAVSSTFCDSATSPSQCATTLPASAPPFVSHTLDRLGVSVSDECSEVLIGILSSGDPLDADAPGGILSTDVGTPGCGLNPDGETTFDCVDVSFTADVDSTIILGSSEWPEFVGSPFTDWMRMGGFFDISIDDWPPASVATIDYGPGDPFDPLDSAGAILYATVAEGETVDLRVADSGDNIYDTFMLVIPAACGDPGVLCGNGQLEPGEQCDDGNNVDGDGCSSICTIEGKGKVAGELGTINNTSLFVAGFFNTFWMVPTIAAVIGVGVYFTKTRMNK